MHNEKFRKALGLNARAINVLVGS